jgi:hypothetical protein
VQYLSRPEPPAGAAGKPEEKPNETLGEKKNEISGAGDNVAPPVEGKKQE